MNSIGDLEYMRHVVRNENEDVLKTAYINSYYQTGLKNLLDKAIDSEGFVVEKNNQTQRVVSIDGEELQAKKFAGMKKGSEIFFKKDLPSLIEMADKIK